MNLSGDAQAQQRANFRAQQRIADERNAGAHGTARFLDEQTEYGPAGLYDVKKSPILTGRAKNGQIIRYGGDGHLLTFGPNGSGKSVSVVVPNMLSYPGTVVCVDPKGAIAPITFRQRLKMGNRMVLLDPFWVVKDPALARYRMSYNPLSFLDPTSPLLLDDVRLIAASLVISEADKNRFFSDSARTILEGKTLFTLAEYDPKHWTLETIVNMALGDFAKFTEQTIPKMQKSDAFGGLVKQMGNQLAGYTGEAGANVWMTLRRSLGFLQSPLLNASLKASDLEFKSLKGDTPTTVYLVLPAQRLDTYGRWLRLILSVMLNEILTPHKPKWPVLFLLDEAAALARLEMIESGIALFRGYSIKLHLIWQDLSQLQAIYPDRWSTFMANAGLKQFFNVNDAITAKYLSESLGNTTREVMSQSVNPGQPLSGGNVSTIARPLLTPDEIMRLPRTDEILLYDGLHPVHARKLRYFDKNTDPEFNIPVKLYDDDPYL